MFPSVKISIIGCLAKGIFEGFRACEHSLELSGQQLSDNQLIDFAVDKAASLYQENEAILQNQGIYFFAPNLYEQTNLQSPNKD